MGDIAVAGTFGIPVSAVRLPGGSGAEEDPARGGRRYDPRKWEQAGMHRAAVAGRQLLAFRAQGAVFPSLWGPFGSGLRSRTPGVSS